ncbi:MAG TPA: universal stress protein [Burkholderiales bacterium]|nr:universal stress protein [Burkholderiales bacterium]
MLKVLVPVNGSECSRAAVDEALRIARANGDAMIQLVNVQPRMPYHVSRFLSGGEISALRAERGARALEGARQRVEAAGVRCAAHVLRGHIVQRISTFAAETGTDQIVIGTSPARGRLFRESIADRLIEESPVPVDVVRGGPIGMFERFGLPAGLGLGLAMFWYSNQ